MNVFRSIKGAHRSTLWLSLLVVAMFGFGFALGPMYSALCKVSGWNGKTSGAATANADLPAMADRNRLVTVEFVTTVNGGRTWEFHADQPKVQVHPGELTTVSFYARNAQDHPVVGQAVPNVAPWDAARYLHKTECFCFNNQSFEAGEQKHMPVRFLLDPALPADVDTVTLSYTFFDVTEAAARKATSEAAAPKS